MRVGEVRRESQGEHGCVRVARRRQIVGAIAIGGRSIRIEDTNASGALGHEAAAGGVDCHVDRVEQICAEHFRDKLAAIGGSDGAVLRGGTSRLTAADPPLSAVTAAMVSWSAADLGPSTVVAPAG